MAFGHEWPQREDGGFSGPGVRRAAADFRLSTAPRICGSDDRADCGIGAISSRSSPEVSGCTRVPLRLSCGPTEWINQGLTRHFPRCRSPCSGPKSAETPDPESFPPQCRPSVRVGHCRGWQIGCGRHGLEPSHRGVGAAVGPCLAADSSSIDRSLIEERHDGDRTGSRGPESLRCASCLS